ncbi:acetyl-CoA carboxylase biotin carboxyl carrier protein [Caldovatus aquaticus]|uniref:Biotin carboxyl carrier protein of acetyl-CoA carboxylase n=1 Tax=Caldovatus aquaticus TaxID=2865671 RepID=A0ABS7F1B0_9PROT|nr:acetyl-CoA carboxylase biotin carboxyl carrier protein [Caldovatus aquaticus]MBW8269416.1 acetyl-CoA carboxylase biotin carboxyl carrier protein [Caldovatus aquaticus]
MTDGIRFDPAQIRELARILRDTDLTEIELVEKDSRIRVVRQVTVVPAAAPASATVAVPAPTAPQAAAAAPSEPAEATPPAGTVTSPMVGIAYLAPEPGAPPFVQVGSKVAQGQTLLLIEAMKTFNQIKAPKAGTVTRILVENGAPVEYGEPLMVIE